MKNPDDLAKIQFLTKNTDIIFTHEICGLDEKEVELPLNSKLICYTDGLTEARGMDQEMYDMERLRQNSPEMGKSMNAEKLGQALKKMYKPT